MAGSVSEVPGRRASEVLLALPVLGLVIAMSPPAAAQCPQEVREAIEMMVSSAAICSDYLARPEVLTEMRENGRYQLGEIGMAQADADAFMDETVARARADALTETRKQVACEMINIRALE
jgi:hypothetical protein